MATIKLGELLVKANVLQESQLTAALSEQQKWGGRLGDILVRMSFLTEDLLVRALSKQMGVPVANLEGIQGLPPYVKAKVPPQTARDLSAVPIQLRDEGKTLVVAMAEPQNVGQLDTLRAISKCRIVPQLAGRGALARAFARFYEGASDVSDFEGSFKLMDAQGRTVVKSAKELSVASPASKSGTTVPRAVASAVPPPSGNLSETLRVLEEAQRREVAALKAMVELLVEKSVFTREEYLAKVKR